VPNNIVFSKPDTGVAFFVKLFLRFGFEFPKTDFWGRGK